MSKLIIIRGNSGSGKTTVANNLQKRLGRNTLVISQDVVRREMLWVNDGKDTLAIPLMISLLKYGREHCIYVILEGILKASWYKPLFETAVHEFGSEIYAYYYDILFEETLRRHESKSKKLEFGEAEMRRWWNEKDYIGLFPEKNFNEDITSDCAVSMICNDLSLDQSEQPITFST